MNLFSVVNETIMVKNVRWRRPIEVNAPLVVCYGVSIYVVAWRAAEVDAVVEMSYLHVLDCHVASIGQVYSCSASCSLKGIASSVNHNVIPLNNNLIINVVGESVDVSVTLNRCCRGVNASVRPNVNGSLCNDWINECHNRCCRQEPQHKSQQKNLFHI